MLVLSRLPGESIMLGQNIEVKVLSVRGGKVVLGTNAPPELPVHRREVYEAIQRGDDSTRR